MLQLRARCWDLKEQSELWSNVMWIINEVIQLTLCNVYLPTRPVKPNLNKSVNTTKINKSANYTTTTNSYLIEFEYFVNRFVDIYSIGTIVVIQINILPYDRSSKKTELQFPQVDWSFWFFDVIINWILGLVDPVVRNCIIVTAILFVLVPATIGPFDYWSFINKLLAFSFPGISVITRLHGWPASAAR